MKTTLSKVLVGRVVFEILVLLMVFVAFDQMTAPSESTVRELVDAMNRELIGPAAVVEARSAVRSSAFLGVVLFVFGILAFLLLCSDLWMVWQFRRKAQPSALQTER